MSNWGDGYKRGYRDALKKLLLTTTDNFYGFQVEFDVIMKKLMEEIGKTKDGAPSMYAVANKCCGGVDAHDVGCRG